MEIRNVVIDDFDDILRLLLQLEETEVIFDSYLRKKMLYNGKRSKQVKK